MITTAKNNSNNTGFKWKEVEPQAVDEPLAYYRLLILNLHKMISLHGVVLLTNGFNEYQREFIKQQCQHACAAPVRVAPHGSFYGSQPASPRDQVSGNHVSLKFG